MARGNQEQSPIRSIRAKVRDGVHALNRLLNQNKKLVNVPTFLQLFSRLLSATSTKAWIANAWA